MPEEILEVTVRTPERVVYRGRARSLLVRGISGDIQILPGHEPLLTALPLYRAVVVEEKGTELLLALHGGLLSVRGTEALVLADAAELPHEIDLERARQAQKRARERLEKPGRWDIARARQALARARLRCWVASR